MDKINFRGNLPTRQHSGDAGADIFSMENFTLKPLERKLVSSGTYIEVPFGYVGYIMSRSGLAHKYGVSVLNCPGVIDFGYTGEIRVNLINLGSEDYSCVKGDRIAQFILQKIELPEFKKVEVFKETIRGDKGHGSTG